VAKRGIRPMMMADWKKKAIEGTTATFSAKIGSAPAGANMSSRF
jgi:hypothetical protein